MSEFTVFLVDDDVSVLRSLSRLIRSAGFSVEAFESAQAFLAHQDFEIPGCIVSDVAMPELDGLQLQAALTAEGLARPMIFLTGLGNIPTSVRAMQAGAVDFLTKPVNGDDLLAAIVRAQAKDSSMRIERAQILVDRAKIARLTQRELQVMTHVVAGRLNRQIASDLGTVENTIKIHRGRMMEKLGVDNVADLVRLARRVGVRLPFKT